jgi:hypothetical protein
MRAIGWIIAVPIAASLAACSRGPRLVGTYQGLQDIPIRPGTDPVVATQIRTLKIIAMTDGKAYLSDAGTPVEGELQYGSNSVTFVPESINNVSIDRQSDDVRKRFTVVLKPLPDGGWDVNGVELKRKP